MSVVLTTTPHGRLYRLLAVRTASDARLLARRAGWRATSSKKRRPTHQQLCPNCRPEGSR